MRKVFYIALLLFYTRSVYSQYYPVYSQYLFSGLVINPAYTGSRDVLSVGMLYRNQWVGFEASPVDQLLSIHAPMKGNRVALGLMVQNDKIGVVRTTGIFPNFAYRLFFNDEKNSILSFGFKGGMVISNSAWDQIEPNDESDYVFATGAHHFALPNFGAGIYFYNSRLYAGISVPCFFYFQEKGKYTIKNDFSRYNYLFTTGFLLDLNDALKIKPSTLVKYESSVGVQADLNVHFIIKDKFWFGPAYRMKDAFVWITELQLSNQIKIGYAYDYSFGEISKLGASHEIMLIYDFNFKIEAVNPRYF